MDRLLKVEELEQIIRKDYEDFRVANETDRMTDILHWTREAQDAWSVKLDRQAVAEWLKSRCTEHETPNYPGRFVTPRYNCDRCIQKLIRLGLNGKLPGEEK